MSETPLIDLSPKLFGVVTKCQNILAEYIVPDSGITDHECINKLLEILDNEKLVIEMRAVINTQAGGG